MILIVIPVAILILVVIITLGLMNGRSMGGVIRPPMMKLLAPIGDDAKAS